MKKTVGAHLGCAKDHYAALKQAPDPHHTAEQVIAEHAGNRARVVRSRERYEQVHALKAEGRSQAAIQRELRPAPMTVRRHYRATSVDELVAGSLAGWPSILDDYMPYLPERWNQGCTNLTRLHREIKTQGFCGGYATIYAYLASFKGKTAPPAVPAPPKARHTPAGSAAARQPPPRRAAQTQGSPERVRPPG
ncbi:MAG: hypothetical protein HOY76_32515 [Streptomyces sp.]|nr:hypothetical protein [Streptomyces sp.]